MEWAREQSASYGGEHVGFQMICVVEIFQPNENKGRLRCGRLLHRQR